jgi:hypothetical protein
VSWEAGGNQGAFDKNAKNRGLRVSWVFCSLRSFRELFHCFGVTRLFLLFSLRLWTRFRSASMSFNREMKNEIRKLFCDWKAQKFSNNSTRLKKFVSISFLIHQFWISSKLAPPLSNQSLFMFWVKTRFSEHEVTPQEWHQWQADVSGCWDVTSSMEMSFSCCKSLPSERLRTSNQKSH